LCFTLCKANEPTMKRSYLLCITLLLHAVAFGQVKVKPATDQLFDDNWRFFKGDPAGAEKKDFNDKQWREISLPHDWTTESNDSIAWYRKSFTLPALKPGSTVGIQFDGIAASSEIWLNGRSMGSHPDGYVFFTRQLTDLVNVLAVRVRKEGAGIYRHVHLQILPPTHLDPANTVITTPLVSTDKAVVRIQTAVNSPANIIFRVLDNNQHIVAADTQQIAGSRQVMQNFEILTPNCWSPAQPYLYTAEIVLPEQTTHIKFGIREIKANAQRGLTINGTPIKLKGANISADNGLLGAAAFDHAEIRKVALLKANGYNAVRIARPSERFLNACDSLGILVIDEAFGAKTYRDFKEQAGYQLTNMIVHDRNHPSVIMWSISNAISESGTPDGLSLTGRFMDVFHVMDSTRLVTAAVGNFQDGLFSLFDVAGYNYNWSHYYNDEKRVPGRVILGTATKASERLDAWNQVEGLPYVIGDFTDFDNDILGDATPQCAFRDVVWRRSPVTMLVSDSTGREQASWTWPGYEGKIMHVRVFARSHAVRLKLNAQTLAAKEVKSGTQSVTFDVPYRPGVIQALAVTSGNELGNTLFVTGTKPVAIQLTTDRSQMPAGTGEIAYVHVDIIDAQGHIVPNVSLPLEVNISGAGTLLAARNASTPHCETYQGKAMVVVRSNGERGHIHVEVKSPGLKNATVSIKAAD
jgi:beta-galactosidase